MKLWQITLIIGLAFLLLVSLMSNMALFYWANQQNNLAAELRTELSAVRNERDDLQREVERLRAESQSPAALAKTMDSIAAETERLRDLAPLSPVSREIVSQAEMASVVGDLMAEDYPPADQARDQIVMSSLELIPPDMDIGQLVNDLLQEQVAGLYVPPDEKLYVVQYGRRLGPLEKVIFSHEHTHALQDQYFDLQSLGLGGGESDRNNDELVAVQALVEGDATFTMQQYVQQYFKPMDMLRMMGAAMSVNQEAINSAPPHLRRSFMFPYQDGLTFVANLYGWGGWEMINEAYVDPPQSSEQILHPYKYPHDMPQQVSLPPLTDTLGSGWRQIDENVLGELTLHSYLNVYTTRNNADRGADGWGGDRYAVYQNKTGQIVLLISIVWDNSNEQAEFVEVYQDFAAKRFGEPLAPPVSLDRPAKETSHWWADETHQLLLLESEKEATTIIIQAPTAELVEQVSGVVAK
ncbi:hypothetical protein QUF63_16600 [Anaerolineales bacterium HSG25]|nr:hypothetical protein [Anaerolineales bacterium HSG25]